MTQARLRKMKRGAGGIFLILLFLIIPVAYASDELDIDRNDDRWFNVENMAPGESRTEKFCAQNDHPTESGDYFLEIDDVTNDKLADQLKFYLIDRSSGKYLIGGSGDRFTVDEMNRAGSVFIERLDPDERNCYTVKITFDENSGNEFQNVKTVFDFDFTLVSTVAREETPPLRPGVPEGGIEPTPEEAVSGASTIAEEISEGSGEGGVQGTATQGEGCSSWPIWAWILFLAGHTGVTNMRRFAYRWILPRWVPVLQTGSAAGALVLWTIYDGCRLYFPEIPLAIVLISVISMFLFRNWRVPVEG